MFIYAFLTISTRIILNFNLVSMSYHNELKTLYRLQICSLLRQIGRREANEKGRMLTEIQSLSCG